jgi:hypothetical protein
VAIRSRAAASDRSALRHLPGGERRRYGSYRSGVDPEYGWYTDRDHDGVVCET